MSRDDRLRWEEKHASTPRAGGLEPPAPFLVENAALVPRGRVVDLAAGSGRNALFLASLGCRVVAVDLARGALERIRGRSAVIDLVQMDLDRPGFRPASIDGLVSVGFLDRRLFPLFHRWLRPGGILVFDTFLVDQREIGHPRNPDFLLGRNELLASLPGLRVLRYREGRVAEGDTLSYRAGVVAEKASENPLGRG
jgi:SAM-dependent methyltransferase